MRKVTRMLSRLMMAVAILTTMLASKGFAETTITIGTGTLTSVTPYYTYWETGRGQYIYLASEMTGLMAGPLTKVGFNVVSVGSPAFLKGLTIKMKNTTATTFPAATFDEAGWTTVYYNVQYTLAAGWNTYVLDTPFNWDGTSNLLINVCFQNGVGEWSTTTNVYATSTGTNYRVAYAGRDNSSAPNIGCVQTASSRSYNRPNVRLSQPGPGTLTGQVTNALTSAPVVGATVTVGTTVATTNASGNYTMTVISGNVTATAAAATYSPLTKTGTVPEGGTGTINFALYPIPAVLNGIVTNAANAAPIKGAKVTVNGWSAYSVEGGAYSLNVYSFGSYPIMVDKAGFQVLTTANYTFNSGVTQTVDHGLTEFPNKPSQPFTAALNTPPTQVNLNWGIPSGDYELIYDDGILETTTDWAVGGNMNAVKFTAINYPVTVQGGTVNIGPESAYPNGTLLADLEPFEVQVFDATGPGGMPGNAIGDPVEVTPANWGWNTFALPNIPIASGNFYIVMIQGGNDPACARLAIDNTATQLRSYSKFETGGGPWLPADGNFMIRAVVNGAGGPIDAPGGIIGYQVFRLKQTEEGNPGLWTSVATPTGTSTIDNSWPSLGDGAYRWAAKAKYTGNVWSDAIFSNVLGKNWTSNVTVNVTMTCNALPQAGSLVTLTCTDAGVDSTYSGMTDATGKVVFPLVWKGNYTLAVVRFAFDNYLGNVVVDGNSEMFDVNLLYVKSPPTGMTVDEGTLLCTWNPPVFEVPVFNEAFPNWTDNEWEHQGSNWVIRTTRGNPAPAAEYYWSPEVFNYEESITSKYMSGIGSSGLMLSFDLLYDDFGGGEYIGMSCEISEDGTNWESVAEFTAAGGNIPWTTFKYDISSYTDKTFKIRFRSWGDDSFYLDWWDIDNVKILATENAEACVIAYNVYLNNVLDGVTTDTSYTIPGVHLVYGNSYDACVKAVFGSGYSTASCDNFTSRWLCPPTELTGEAQEATAYLTWTKPHCTGGGGCTVTEYIFDDNSYEMNWWIGAGATGMLGNEFPLDPATSGIIQLVQGYFVTSSTPTPLTIRIYDGTFNMLWESPPFTPVPDSWNAIAVPDLPFTGPFLAMVSWVGNNTTATFGYDNNGPMASLDNEYAYYAPLGGWFKLTGQGLAGPGNFMIRATACIDGKKGVELTAGIPYTPVLNNNVTIPFVGIDNVSTVASDNVTYAPLANPTLLGYNIYRDGNPIAYINDVDVLEYYDFNLNPGNYCYTVKGYYDVSPVPPGNDNSPAAGPACVAINYGFPVPFYEPWDQGNFNYFGWSHGNNWSVTPAFGNPAPAADFSWQPALTNYNESIETSALSAGPYTCGNVYLSFDYKLVDRNQTGAEFLTVECYVDGAYKQIAEFSNNGDVAWMNQQFELKNTIGKAFKVRFRAHGDNSLDILHWYVDNIMVWAVCTPAIELDYTQSQNHVMLTWTAPTCYTEAPFTIIWDDNTYENGIGAPSGTEYWFGNQFPVTAGESGFLTSFDMLFYNQGTASTEVTLDIFDENYSLIGSSDPFMQGDGVWQTVEVPMIPYTGTFYALVHEIGGTPRPHWFGYDSNGPHAVDNYAWYSDGSTFGTVSSLGIEAGVFLQRAHGVIMTPNPEGGPDGYNVYRTGATGVPPYSKVNTDLVTNTSFTDVIPLTDVGTYKYYVAAIYMNTDNTVLCDPSTDSITVLFPAVGMSEIGKGMISIYPNPATEALNVRSDYTISAIEVMNFVGQTVYSSTDVDAKTAKLNVTTYTPGVYFVKVTTSEGIRTIKITVTH